MTKIDSTRTELVWPGKYDTDGNLVTSRRVNLPFQVIERVSETPATRAERQDRLAGHVGTLFDYWQVDRAERADTGDGWRNKLIWGDNLYAMTSLLEQFAGQIDLIYIDPPFATGTDFSFTTIIGETEEEIYKQQSIIEEKAYRDTWGKGNETYLSMMHDRFLLMRELMSEKGTIYVHLDYRLGHYVKVMLDSIFGLENFINEIVWHYRRWPAKSANFQRQHDKILVYAKKNGRHTFNTLLMPLSEGTNRRWRGQKSKVEFLEGVRQVTQMTDERSPGAPMDDVWDVPVVNSQAKERVDYATQKPEELLERIIEASSDEGDLIADFFCGSGTTMAVAEKSDRRWIACDLGRFAIHTSRKRLMDIPDCQPFEILNLGRYERQVWQVVAFGGRKQPEQMLIFEYLKFILELYSAQPLAGTQYLHGKKGTAVVHVGAVDAPVTIDEVNACLTECLAMGQKELHILGWEWEMGLANLMVGEARRMGIRLLLLAIPREVMEQQAVDKGDIHFYELAYLEVKLTTNGRAVTIELADFVIPNDELIPPDVRQKISKWSDYVDYWAVDWDFRDDTFVNGWTSYRTRQDRKLDLKTEAHVYEAPGTYHVLVKAIDIFGNDTSQHYEVVIP